MKFSKYKVNNNYTTIYNKSLDSFKIWKEKSLKTFLYCRENESKIDSLVCFNSEGNKGISAILVRSTFYKDQTADAITYFYYVKIKENWNFFNGPTIYIPRAGYGYPKNQPLPFSKLHEIAMKEVFSGYLKKTWNGKWEINEAFFDRIEFQYEKWAYWDSNGKEIINSKLSTDSLQKLYLDRIIYDKYRFQ